MDDALFVPDYKRITSNLANTLVCYQDIEMTEAPSMEKINTFFYNFFNVPIMDFFAHILVPLCDFPSF